MNDTIAAIATASGKGAISIIRVSGKEALDIVSKIFTKNLKNVESHTINYGYIKNEKEIIDEVLVSVMKAPKTYTMEDVVEINCHGGITTTNKVLELLIYNGIRLAEPGEFTKRAFLNGRIDATEAEGIMDLIEAKTDESRKIAINKLNGKTSNLIRNLRNELVEVISNINVNIDYPEYDDIEEITIPLIKEKMTLIKQKINEILISSKEGKIIKDGIVTSIIGRPNVGKSSLLNTLLEENKAIVTDIEGTTRDIVEGTINLGGLVLNIIDTAGIRTTDNIVEKMGVLKSLDLINKSDLVLYILNNNEKLTEEDKNILEKIKEKNHIIVVNKVDLEKNIDIEDENLVFISAKENIGIDDLKDKIKKLYNLEQISNKDLNYITNAKSIATLNRVYDKIEILEKNLENTLIDMVEIDLREIWNLLGEIIGETYEDELINEMFSKFCLGK